MSIYSGLSFCYMSYVVVKYIAAFSIVFVAILSMPLFPLHSSVSNALHVYVRP